LTLLQPQNPPLQGEVASEGGRRGITASGDVSGFGVPSGTWVTSPSRKSAPPPLEGEDLHWSIDPNDLHLNPFHLRDGPLINGRMRMKFRVSAALCTTLIATPAFAEKFSTVWTFRPVTQVPPTTAELDKPFFEQRALPYRLVRLSDELTIGKGKPLAKGTLLYLIMDKTNRMAFCTFKDSSAGNAAKSLFIPALDTRPCLIDDDRDGKFEKTFSVFELWGSVAPTAKGDMAKAKPITPVAYAEADPGDTMTDYRLRFEVHAKGSVPQPQLRFIFSAKNESATVAYPSEKDGDGYVANPFNYKIRMKLIDNKRAEVALTPTGEDLMVVLFDKYELMKPEVFPKAKVGKN
jgi:hypothetical protein